MMVMALILIVDDSPTELHVMQKALEKHGFRTAAAADGAEGVRLAREMSPDLIFMDIVMPGMNGYQATRALANDPRTRSIPIVMVTSKGQETDRIWGLRQGAVDYMVKPVSPDQLVAKAQATLSA
jgi:twitching motility two-component system response regulator PilH